MAAVVFTVRSLLFLPPVGIGPHHRVRTRAPGFQQFGVGAGSRGWRRAPLGKVMAAGAPVWILSACLLIDPGSEWTPGFALASCGLRLSRIAWSEPQMSHPLCGVTTS